MSDSPPREAPPLLALYGRLRAHFGHRGWWPGRTPFEVVVGAILTQNTAWRNVERALANLRRARLLSVAGIRRVRRDRLARLIRPSGYYNQKAERLKGFIRFLDDRYGGSMAALRGEETGRLRSRLLAVRGIGPETADSIVLYAARKPVFVVDAYTRRVLVRHRYLEPELPYDEVRRFIESRLVVDVALWNDFHAQFVAVGHHHCGPRPRCEGCPLEPLIPPEGIRPQAPTRK